MRASHPLRRLATLLGVTAILPITSLAAQRRGGEPSLPPVGVPDPRRLNVLLGIAGGFELGGKGGGMLLGGTVDWFGGPGPVTGRLAAFNAQGGYPRPLEVGLGWSLRDRTELQRVDVTLGGDVERRGDVERHTWWTTTGEAPVRRLLQLRAGFLQSSDPNTRPTRGMYVGIARHRLLNANVRTDAGSRTLRANNYLAADVIAASEPPLTLGGAQKRTVGFRLSGSHDWGHIVNSTYEVSRRPGVGWVVGAGATLYVLAYDR